MPRAAKTPPVVGSAYAIRDDSNGGHLEFIDQAFKLNIAHLSRALVCFRLSVTITNNDAEKIPVHIQITTEHITALGHRFCTLDGSDSLLQEVCRQVGGKRDMTCLQFQLGKRAQLIVPMNFTIDDACNGPALSSFDSVARLADTLSFSLYFPQSIWSKQLLQRCASAVTDFPTSKKDQKHLEWYLRAVDLQRLYAGKGGRVVDCCDRNVFQPNWERDRCTTPASIGSCATNDYKDDQRYLDSPPRYDGSSGQKLATTSDDVSNFFDSPAVDSAPPDYSATECLPGVSGFKRFCRDDDPGGSPKRVCSIATISTLASTADVLQLDVRPGSHHDLMLQLGHLQQYVMQSDKRTMQLERDFNTLRTQNAKLKDAFDVLKHRLERVESLNESMGQQLEVMEDLNKSTDTRLEEADERLDQAEERIGDLDSHTRKLDDDYEELGQQLPDMLDDARADMLELAKDTMADVINEHMAKGCGGDVAVTETYVHEHVATRIADFQKKLLKAIQD